MTSYEIPDPFQSFVLNKYKDYKGMLYDYMAKEWHLNCGSCKEKMYAPNKKSIIKARLYHTRNKCLGGY